mgnify:CR=1 FL=1
MTKKAVLISGMLMIAVSLNAQNYCTITGNIDCSDDHITNVSIAGINNDTQCATGYSIYTGMNGEITAGETYTINVTIANPGTAAGVWIDYNQNKQFSADEFVPLGFSETENDVLQAEISVPENAVGGVSRMRVKCQFDTTVGENSSCALPALMLGEIEDYSINITAQTASAGDFNHKSISLYPNPAGNTVTVGLPGVSIAGSLEIYTMGGQKVMQTSIAENTQVDINRLSAGVYLMKAVTGEGVYTAKLIRQ